VLIALPNELQKVRVGIGAGRSIGNAVKRNRAKRVLREVMRPQLERLSPSNDLLLLARSKLLNSSQAEIEDAIKKLIKRAGLANRKNNEHSN
jgi:ribonuclease P protein component